MNSERPSVQCDSAYQKLRRLLLHEQIVPGTRLAEAQWSERLGVNRAALRQAMSMLALEDLLRIGEKGGFFVPVLSQQDLDEILDVRAILENGAVRAICNRPPSQKDHRQLVAACDQLEVMLQAEMELGFLEADRNFHLLLMQLSGNQRLFGVYERAALPLRRSNEVDPLVRRAGGVKTIAEHRQIARFIHARDCDAALELLNVHLLRAHRLTPVYA